MHIIPGTVSSKKRIPYMVWCGFLVYTHAIYCNKGTALKEDIM